MSNEGDRAAVFRTTKVRTKLKGDGSWLRRSNEPQAETQEEKPWMAEVRASRLNGAPDETSPVSSPTNTTPPPTKSVTERAPTSGFLIRGVFTKLDQPPSSSASNGFRTTQFNKKPSDSYKRIAPHTVRPTSENQEGQLSPEEMEKRTEAASNVLKRSAVRQRSYVLSAAKKYESTEKAPDVPPANSTPSFVAKRVEIADDDDDDDESSVTPAAAKTETPSPVVSVAPAASTPEPKPRKIVSTTVKTDVDVAVNEPKVEEANPEAVKEDLLPVSIMEKDPHEGMTPGCTKVATPLPELIVDCIQAASTKPELEDSDVSEQAKVPLVELSKSPSEIPTSSESPAPESSCPVVLETPVPVSPVPVIPATVSSDIVISATPVTVNTEPQLVSIIEPEPEPESESNPSAEPSSSVDTLTALSDTLISFDTSPSSVKDDEPALAQEEEEEEEESSVDNQIAENSKEQEAAPALSNGVLITEDLLGFTNGPDEEPAEPVPPSPGRWSQDLLSELDSEPNPDKICSTLDLLSSDVIIINTEARSLSMQREEEGEEEEQTDETAKDTQSQEDSAYPLSSHMTTTVTESSSADPFDPYPIGTTSPNSSSDLIQPLTDISINSESPTTTEDKSSEIIMNSNALESLADNIIPIDTDSTSTQQSWEHTWETGTPQQTNTEESQEPESGAEGQAVDQQTLVLFERKTTENDSPWDRWTSPTVYTVTTTEDEEGEEEEEEESPEDTQTVTTITTIREIHGEPEPAMDRSETSSRTVIEGEQRVQTPEPEAKKGFVYVKEYVNASELSLHNPRDTLDSSISQSYSIPSRAPLSTTCTYCGQQVGCDGKITIEHLNINCHPACFKCDMCSKPMGDLLYSMFLHGGKVYCEGCYSTVI